MQPLTVDFTFPPELEYNQAGFKLQGKTPDFDSEQKNKTKHNHCKHIANFSLDHNLNNYGA